MRYSEFKIVEKKLIEAPDDGTRGGATPPTNTGPGTTPTSDPAVDAQNDDAARQNGLTAGPPYPQEQMDAVRALQTRLEELGYSVGVTGIDGKYGPRTSRAVAAFMRDNNINSSDRGRSISAADLEKLKTAEKVDNPSPTGNNTRYDPRVASGDPNFQAPGYPPEMTRARMEEIIRAEAQQRGIDPNIAVRIFRAEGASSYQSTVRRSGRGSLGGREASFGPFQLYIGGGLGNEYQDATGRDLTTDNTVDGITNQIRFALDHAARNGWGAWYGRGPAGVAANQGVNGARAIRNWS